MIIEALMNYTLPDVPDEKGFPHDPAFNGGFIGLGVALASIVVGCGACMVYYAYRAMRPCRAGMVEDIVRSLPMR